MLIIHNNYIIIYYSLIRYKPAKKNILSTRFRCVLHVIRLIRKKLRTISYYLPSNKIQYKCAYWLPCT